MLKFTKMHGLGNDYVYVDCTNKSDLEIDSISKLASRMSDRHFGIGSDGLILICRSDVADFRMKMYNQDGSQAEMCGNGIRCVGKFVYVFPGNTTLLVGDTLPPLGLNLRVIPPETALP